MNAHVELPQIASPLTVTDPNIRKQLQLAGLRFICSQNRWIHQECIKLGSALKSGAMTSDEVDLKLGEMGLLEAVYPHLMAAADHDWWSTYQRWEAEDSSRPKPPAPSKPEYRTPQATVDCFFGWIVRQDRATQARWLAEHPKDAPYLRKLWEDKCKAQSK
jgi:hypothetical protein